MSAITPSSSILAPTAQLHEGRVVALVEGLEVTVRIASSGELVGCRVLETGTGGPELSIGDSVLVWLPGETSHSGVLLGRIGVYSEPSQPVIAPSQRHARPVRLVLEAQEEIVLRNSHAKLTLGANGDVEIVARSFSARSQRLLRLLAPLIKLN